MNAVLNTILTAFGARPDVDKPAVAKAVTRFAHNIGCDLSNQAAAVTWALRYGVNTIQACRIGRERAVVLRNRQPPDAA